jgi:glucokinase
MASISLFCPRGKMRQGRNRAQGDFLFDRIRARAERQMMPAYAPVRIIPAALGEQAGLAGAAKLAWSSASPQGSEDVFVDGIAASSFRYPLEAGDGIG